MLTTATPEPRDLSSEELWMSEASGKTPRAIFSALFCALCSILTFSQTLPPEAVPPNFQADNYFAARIRKPLPPDRRTVTIPYVTGRRVLEQLTEALPASQTRFSWDLRIAGSAGNMFSSPDGTIIVDEGLVRMLGSRSGLWAAALSHEIAHVVRRDWARRNLFQKSLVESENLQVIIGDPGSPATSWVDARTSASRFAAFCQTQETEADTAGLMIMARAGFHPAFMPALYHILQAQPKQLDDQHVDSLHPLWNNRVQQLRLSFVTAGKEFDYLWPDRFSSPGGNPPIVVYAGSPSAHRNLHGDVEMSVPLHCDNLYGSVEVVLRLVTSKVVREERQYTGCTSNQTLVKFTVGSAGAQLAGISVQAQISVLDDHRTLLTRSLAPRIH